MKARAKNVSPADYSQWQYAATGQVHNAIFRLLPEIENRQADIYRRFMRLEYLYDPNNLAVLTELLDPRRNGILSENVIFSNIDTVTAIIASVEVSPRVETDGADWSQQRTARHLEWYSEALMALHDVHPKARLAFKSAAKKGTGLVKVYADRNKRLRVEHVMPDDVIVDEAELRGGGQARQLHHRMLNVSTEQLKIEHPEFAEQIERAGTSLGSALAQNRVTYSNRKPNERVVIESWYLPIGRPGDKFYKAGRHTKTINGFDLLDEEWTKPHFPIARLIWESREDSWYGISGAERIENHQKILDKLNFQIDRALDQMACPTTYVRWADAGIAARTQSKLGTIATYKAELPHTVIPPAVSPEVYSYRDRVKSSAFEEFGVSRMAAQSYKPSGIDSGVALREYRDQSTQRFATQEKAFERFILDIVWLIIDVCKDLGKDAPVVMRPSRFGGQKIKWSDVDMRDVKIQLAAAATLNRTPAGRQQTVMEWAQAGVISQDEARRLINHPDLERAMSLYTAATESVEYCLERIADGEVVMPEPFMNLAMCAWRAQQQYLIWQTVPSVPEDILEACRQFTVQAVWMSSQAANENAPPGAPGAMPPMPGAPPNMVTPNAAISPQAAQAVA